MNDTIIISLDLREVGVLIDALEYIQSTDTLDADEMLLLRKLTDARDAD